MPAEKELMESDEMRWGGYQSPGLRLQFLKAAKIVN